MEAIERETDVNKVEQILKEEFVGMFNDMKKRGISLSEKTLEDRDYHILRDENNQIIVAAEEKMNTLRNVFDAQTFVRIEEEALNEVLSSEAQQEK